MAGYSKRNLKDKLGIKDEYESVIINPPKGYFELTGKLTNFTHEIKPLAKVNFIHYFTTDKKDLLNNFAHLMNSLNKNGMLWISWPKKSSKISTDLDENIIRDIGLQAGLVDVKVCAVDEHWSGLKFVFRLKDR